MNTCVMGWITQFSLFNKRNQTELLSFQSMLNFSCLISLIVVINFCRKLQMELVQLCDNRYSIIIKSEVTPSDYSVLITNVPRQQNIDYETELKSHFKSHYDCDVQAVNFMFNLKFLKQQETILEQLVEQKKLVITQIADNQQEAKKKLDNRKILSAIDNTIKDQK